MPQIQALTLHDGTNAITFAPSARTEENGMQVQEFLQSSTSVAPLLRHKLKIGFRQPTATKMGRMRVEIVCATQETVSGTSDQGYVAPPKIAYRDSVRVDFDIHERSSTASRAVLLALVNRVLAQGVATGAGDFSLAGITYSPSLSPSSNIGTNIYRTLEGMY